jgi:hypothetical protein
VSAPTGDQPQQVDLGGVGVGQLVHVHVPAPVALRGQHRGVVDEHGRGRAHQLGLVVGDAVAGGRVAEAEHLPVLGQEVGGGDPVRAPVPPAQIGQGAGADAPLGGSQQQVAQFGRERPCPHGAPQRHRPTVRGIRGGEHLADDGVLLGPGEQAWGGFTPFGRGEAQHAEGVRRECPDQRLGHGGPVGPVPTDARLDPVAQGGGRPSTEREDEDVRRVDALGHPGRDGLDQRRRLPRARPAQYQQRSVAMGDGGPLPGVEVYRSRGDAGLRSDQPVPRERGARGPACRTCGHAVMQPRWPGDRPYRHAAAP